MTNSDIDARTQQLTQIALDAGHLVALEGFVSEACVAELIGVTVSTVRGWRATGRHALQYRRLGGTRGRVQYSLRSVAAFLVECETNT